MVRFEGLRGCAKHFLFAVDYEIVATAAAGRLCGGGEAVRSAENF